MTKRIVILTLTLLLCILPLFSCGAPTAQSLYESASKTMEEAKGGEVKMTITTSQTVAGQSQTMEIIANTKFTEDAMAMEMTMDMGEILGEQTISYTYVDECFYMVMGDEKMKVTCTKEQMEELMSEMSGTISAEASDLPTLTEEDLKEIELVKADDGSYSFNIELTKEQIASLLEGMGESVEADYDDISATFYFTNKKVLSKVDIEMSLTISGITSAITISAEYVNFGTTPTVAAPADADDYTAYTYDELFAN